MESFVFSMNAVLPLVCLTALGYALRQSNFFNDDFIKAGNKFVFSVCLPCLMFVNIYNIKKMSSAYYKVMLFASVSMLALIAIGTLFCVFFVRDPKQKGVMAQAFFRSNFAIIGIPLARSIFGDEGGAMGAVILACSIPLFNISSVFLLTVFLKEGQKRISVRSILYKILKNPLIDGIFFGGLMVALRPYVNGWTLKDGEIRFVYRVIEELAKAASPFSLVILGGQFQISAVKRLFSKIAFAVFVRLVAVPVAGLFAAHLIFTDFKGPEYAALLALFGSPIAVASAIMANQMNNDGELAGQILVWTTFFSGLTLFCFISFFRFKGIF
ncbi:AEC family transporter [Treponema parvum]|uniref:AEC family transporter n=1 Tax=Treponema parvum TaxID=138851 RepID=UPI001AEBBCF5|nr:AEC family transporter [Treponema parvum]QTQ15924.1 AEC family transporter [Treponema parvum]